MAAEFELCQKVVTTDEFQTVDYKGAGFVGVIVGIEDMLVCYEYSVKFDWGRTKCTADELAPAPQALASTAAADDGDSGYSELLDELGGKIKRLERENKRLKDALEPFAEAWVQNRFNPASKIAVLTLSEKFLWYELGITAKALEDAHTAFFNLAQDAAGAEPRGEGEGG